MSTEAVPQGPMSRRRLLAALGGGAALAALGAAVRPGTARAANGQTVTVGADLEGTTVTSITRTNSNGVALRGKATASGGIGLAGDSDLYYGITGFGGSCGVSGSSTDGTGAQGLSPNGIGVYAFSDTGTALDVDGPSSFKTSGIATVKAGNDSKSVDPGVNINGKSKILVTLLSNPGNAAVVQWVKPLKSKDKFKVIMSQAVANDTDFAWFVIS